MSVPTLRSIVIAALTAAGPKGMRVPDLVRHAGAARGKPTTADTIIYVVGEIRPARDGVQVHASREAGVRRYVIEAEAAGPADDPDPPPERVTGIPASLTAAVMGDPLPGRSALDARRRAMAGAP